MRPNYAFNAPPRSALRSNWAKRPTYVLRPWAAGISLKRDKEVAIYVSCPLERLIAWLNVLVGPLEESARVAETFFYQSSVGPVVVICVQDHPFIDVCFHTHNSPWTTHVDFGRQAARELGCMVRCEPGHYYPEVDPLSNVWLEINADQERLIALE